MVRGEMTHKNERSFCGNIIYDGSTISQMLAILQLDMSQA